MKTLSLIFLLVCRLTLMAQVEITSQGTTFKLPDISTLQSPEALKGGAATAQLAAQSLTAEAAGLNAQAKAAEADLAVLSTKLKSYSEKLDNYNKTGLDPYKEDLDRYTVNLNKYSSLISTHNADVAANNALPADKRDAANVARLNSRKADLDDWKGKLDTWKGSLDSKKAGLDQLLQALNADRQELLPQYAAIKAKTNTIQLKQKLAYQQLLSCKSYADKCIATLKTNYPTYTGTASTGLFGTSVWTGTVADLQTEMEKLKALSGKVFDGN